MDSTLVEFKLASNTKLKHNLQQQVDIYKAANNTNKGLKVIMYFTNNEYLKIQQILEDLNLVNDHDIILINACNDKVSASNVR